MMLINQFCCLNVHFAVNLRIEKFLAALLKIADDIEVDGHKKDYLYHDAL